MTKAIRKFERLERLCPFFKLDEEERIRKTLEMFHCDIAIFVEIGKQPTMVIECYERALRAWFKLNWMKEGKARGVKLDKGRRNRLARLL